VKRTLVADLVVAAAAVATFARGVPAPLVATWDDGRFLIDFPPTREPSLAALRTIFTEEHFQAWHPLHLLSYWIDLPWAGPSGPVLHGVNLALWVLGLLVVRRLFERLGLTAPVAVLATLLYGLHPVQVEAVSWATGRKEILALLFSALALLAHLAPGRYFTREAWSRARGAERLRLVARSAVPGLFFVLAALSKTTTLPLPAVLFLCDLLVGRVRPRTALLRQLPAVLLAAGLAVIVVLIWRGHEMIRPEAGGGSFPGRVLLVCATFTHHVTTALWPSDTSPIYPITDEADFGFAVVLVPLLLFGSVAAAWWRGYHRAAFALAATIVLLLPVVNAVPVYFQVQDRYLSLPLLPMAFGAGVAIDALVRRAGSFREAWLPLGLAAAAVAALAWRTVDYQWAWSSDANLWWHATRTHPTAYYAWMKLGEHRRDRGDLAGAIRAYGKAVEVAPDLRLTHAALFHAVALRDERRAGLLPRAMEWTERYGASLDSADALRGVGGDLLAAGYKDAVLLPLGHSLDLDPVPDDRLEQAALVQLSQGRHWLARYYVSRLRRPPVHPRLQPLVPEGAARRPPTPP
jgi:hypothetical protein